MQEMEEVVEEVEAKVAAEAEVAWAAYAPLLLATAGQLPAGYATTASQPPPPPAPSPPACSASSRLRDEGPAMLVRSLPCPASRKCETPLSAPRSGEYRSRPDARRAGDALSDGRSELSSGDAAAAAAAAGWSPERVWMPTW